MRTAKPQILMLISAMRCLKVSWRLGYNARGFFSKKPLALPKKLFEKRFEEGLREDLF